MRFLAITTACLVLVILGNSSCASRRSEPFKQKEFASAQGEVATGEKLFMTHCQKCHPAGEAGLGPSVNANLAPGFVKRFQMRHGLGVMPSFDKETLSPADLRAISTFLHEWKSN